MMNLTDPLNTPLATMGLPNPNQQQPQQQPQQPQQTMYGAQSYLAPMSANQILALQQRCASVLKMDMSRMSPLFDIINRRGTLAMGVMQNIHNLHESDKTNAIAQFDQLDAALRDMLGLA